MDGESAAHARSRHKLAGALLLALSGLLVLNAIVVVSYTVDDGGGLAKGFALIAMLIFLAPVAASCFAAGLWVTLHKPVGDLGRGLGATSAVFAIAVIGFQLYYCVTHNELTATSIAGIVGLLLMAGTAAAAIYHVVTLKSDVDVEYEGRHEAVSRSPQA